MIPKVGKKGMFVPTAKDIWEIVGQTYSIKLDAAMLFELRTMISVLK